MNKKDTEIFNKAVALAQSGDKANAYAQLESILQSNPYSVDLLLWLAFTTSNLSEAEKHISLAERLEPDNFGIPNAKQWLVQEKAKPKPKQTPASNAQPAKKSQSWTDNIKPIPNSPQPQPIANKSYSKPQKAVDYQQPYQEPKGMLVCANCQHNDQFQKVSSIFASGVTTTTSSGFFFDTNADFGSVTSSSRSSTLLADRLRPPMAPKKNYFIPICLIIISLPFFFIGPNAFPMGFLLIGVGIFLIYGFNKSYDQKMPEYQKAYKAWQRDYYCYRCDLVTRF